MDPLSDTLQALRLDGAFFYFVEAAAPWAICNPSTQEMRAALHPEPEHLICYHILLQGSCWGGLEGEEPRRMGPGDVLMFPQGAQHVMMSGPTLTPEPYHLPKQDTLPFNVRLGEGEGASAYFVCGFLGCAATPANPLLDALPPMLHMPAREGSWVSTFAANALASVGERRSGAHVMLSRLAELMFMEVVRWYSEEEAPGEGWLAALADPFVGRAITLMHERPRHDWTVAELAGEVAASRTVLAERFTRLVGIPPMQYLMQWRSRLAATLLRDGNMTLAEIAERVGYESEGAFSRAFKRVVGVPPGTWRRARAGGRIAQLPMVEPTVVAR